MPVGRDRAASTMAATVSGGGQSAAVAAASSSAAVARHIGGQPVSHHELDPHAKFAEHSNISARGTGDEGQPGAADLQSKVAIGVCFRGRAP